jgi:hypothetical protein
MDCRNAAKGSTKQNDLSRNSRIIKTESDFKVSGTVKGTIMAGIKIIGWIFKYTFK